MISNFLPTEATHSSLDLFEKHPLLVTFENAFTQMSILVNEIFMLLSGVIQAQRTEFGENPIKPFTTNSIKNETIQNDTYNFGMVLTLL